MCGPGLGGGRSPPSPLGLAFPPPGVPVSGGGVNGRGNPPRMGLGSCRRSQAGSGPGGSASLLLPGGFWEMCPHSPPQVTPQSPQDPEEVTDGQVRSISTSTLFLLSSTVDRMVDVSPRREGGTRGSWDAWLRLLGFVVEPFRAAPTGRSLLVGGPAASWSGQAAPRGLKVAADGRGGVWLRPPCRCSGRPFWAL